MAVRRSRRNRTGGTWVDGADVDLLIDQLRKVPQEAKRHVRKAILQATQTMRADMARRAGWSDRIPGAIGMRASFTRGQVEIRVRSSQAPHARNWEGIQRGEARWPVFGHRDRKWGHAPVRPFFFPAVDAHRTKVRDAVETAVFKTMPR